MSHPKTFAEFVERAGGTMDLRIVDPGQLAEILKTADKGDVGSRLVVKVVANWLREVRAGKAVECFLCDKELKADWGPDRARMVHSFGVFTDPNEAILSAGLIAFCGECCKKHKGKEAFNSVLIKKLNAIDGCMAVDYIHSYKGTMTKQ